MGALRQRLAWGDDGALHDGPRRYLMMRTDVLMGTLQRLPRAQQEAWLQAWAASTCEHGGASLQAYAQMVGADAAALTSSTVQAAADLGWGQWAVTRDGDSLKLQVQGSPFVHGWRAAQATMQATMQAIMHTAMQGATQPSSTSHTRPGAQAAAGTAMPDTTARALAPCCAPISGMFSALAGMLLQGPVDVQETRCAAQQMAPSNTCHFVARRLAP